MSEIHEGERLEKLLASTRYEKKQFAEAIGVTKQAVGRWIKLNTFSKPVWEKLLVGLSALGLDPSAIRPDYGKRSSQPTEDLTRLVENWPRVQLSVIRRILESDDTSRRVLLAYIYGALRSTE